MDGWSDLRVIAGCQCPARNNVPKTAVPSPTCHFSPTNATMPGLGVTVINSSLMAKLSGPIPVCLLSCKTFPWLAREKLGGKGKRLSFQNINLPLPLLPANLPANRLKERKPTLRTEPGGAGGCSLQLCLLTTLVLSAGRGLGKSTHLLLPGPLLTSHRERNLAPPKEPFSLPIW